MSFTQALLIILGLHAALGEELTKDACFEGEPLLEHCICEVTSLSSASFYSPSKVKLSCETSFDYAHKVVQILGDSIPFVSLSMSSLISPHLSHHNFTGFLEHSEGFRNLSVSNSGVTSIAAGTFQHLKNLVYLDLSSNSLYVVESKWFVGLGKLQWLSLANNSITSVQRGTFDALKSLKFLDLSKNEISSLAQSSFFHLSNLTNVSLAENKIRNLGKGVFLDNEHLKVNLTGNPWVCDKNLLDLRDWLRIHEVGTAYCNEPQDFVNMTLQIGLLIVYLELDVEASPICNETMCNCTVSKDKQIVTIDCSGRGFAKLPENLPYKTRVLDLRNNFIESLTMDHVNATQWADVIFLHLNNNRINSLKGLEGTWLLRNVVVLHLTNNKLTEIPIHILEQFRDGLIEELYLSGNPWNCDCNTVRFQTWMQDNYKTIKDFEGIRCSPESGAYSNQPIFNLLKSQLCPQHVQLVNYLDVLNGLMAVAIVLIIAKLSYDFWFQKRTGKLPRFFSLNLPK